VQVVHKEGAGEEVGVDDVDEGDVAKEVCACMGVGWGGRGEEPSIFSQNGMILGY
jgi:hypothetical protein